MKIYVHYKLEQFCSVINWGKQCYKLGQLLPIRTTIITKRDSYYKLGQVLQIRAVIKNWGITK